MAEFNEIKFKEQISNYQTLKAGLKRSDLKARPELQSIFDKIDTNNSDGVLDEQEIQNFMKEIVDVAKGGRNKKLSKKEANKFLNSIGLQNVDETKLFELLNTFSTQTKNINKTTKNEENNSNIVEYKDGHTEEIFADGAKLVTTKDNDLTIEIRQDREGKTISRTETDADNNSIKYEEGKKTTTQNNGTVIIEEGEVKTTTTPDGTVITEKDGGKTTKTPDGTTVTEKDGIKTTTTPEGVVITEDNGVTTTISSDKNTVIVKDTNTGTTKTTIFNPENDITTETTTNKEGNSTILTSKEGKNLSQQVMEN